LAASPPILSGLREIASDYDALVCDVWGVVHNGVRAHEAACDALRRFRASLGPVVLLSNAPRPIRDLEIQFERLGVPVDCYDAVVTSGVTARNDLVKRAEAGGRALYHLGPERDRGIFEGLPFASTDPAHADVVLCTGLFDDDVETPEDYEPLLLQLKARRLEMVCANPDLVVQRGGKLVYCAGALAKIYESLGGKVVYCGKPYLPIYQATLAETHGAKRPLAIGDGLDTDIKGANAAGLDALFVGHGIHAKEIEPFTGAHLRSLFDKSGVHVRAVMRTLVW
jgi:HAD superfamily hydrolase (TIGR01459 family)